MAVCRVKLHCFLSKKHYGRNLLPLIARAQRLDEIGGMAKPVKDELENIVDSILTGGNYADKSIVAFPRFFLNPLIGRVFTWINNRTWRSMASKNGSIIDSKPYL
jgi:hypothetical protein